MIVNDTIYGKAEVTEPVLVELIGSPSVQRLKRIAQFGVPDEYWVIPNFSRFDHSVGAMLLLRRFGASIKEQAAGLLHDVSHTAFSHVYDWVMEDHEKPGHQEDHQDRRHEAYILGSELPMILASHGIEPRSVCDYHHFTMLELDKPHICADRLDYTLREIGPQMAADTLEWLAVQDGRFVFTDPEPAKRFALAFLGRQDDHWGSFEAVARFNYLAQILRWALEAGDIEMGDFEHDDDHVMAKVKASREPLVIRGLQVIGRKPLPRPVSRRVLYKKFRHVDPAVKTVDGIRPLSRLDKGFAAELETARKRNDEGHTIAPLVELL